MNKGKKLYEGKAKILYETKDKDLVIQYFKGVKWSYLLIRTGATWRTHGQEIHDRG